MDILEHEVHRYMSSRKSRASFHELRPSLLTVDFPALTRIKNSELEMVEVNGVVDGKTAFKWYN